MTPDVLARAQAVRSVDDVLALIEDFGWSASSTRLAIQRYADIQSEKKTMPDHKIFIGNKRLIANFPQLQIPVGQEARFILFVEPWEIKIYIDFLDDPAHEPAVGTAQVGDDGVRLTFYNWQSHLVISMKEPARLVEMNDGETVEFLASSSRSGNINLVTVAFLGSRSQGPKS